MFSTARRIKWNQMKHIFSACSCPLGCENQPESHSNPAVHSPPVEVPFQNRGRGGRDYASSKERYGNHRAGLGSHQEKVGRWSHDASRSLSDCSSAVVWKDEWGWHGWLYPCERVSRFKQRNERKGKQSWIKEIWIDFDTCSCRLALGNYKITKYHT